MTMLSEILDPVSLDHLAQHLQAIEQPVTPRKTRPTPPLATSQAGGRATARKRRAAKIARLAAELATW